MRMRTIDSFNAREARRAEDKRLSYAWYKAHGVCVTCHERNAEPGRVQCHECIDRMNERRKQIRIDRKQEKRCARCGNALSAYDIEHGYINCIVCRKYMHDYGKRYYHNVVKKKRRKKSKQK